MKSFVELFVISFRLVIKLFQSSPVLLSDKLIIIRLPTSFLPFKFSIRGCILCKVVFEGGVRFMDLLRLVDGIGAKMLSKELQDLEINLLIKRTVLNTRPITVEYELTPHGRTLKNVINEIHLWGVLHRKKIIEQ